MPTKKQPKVSILVPCYNVEKYLPQCLDSAVNQTLKDIEIIVINDGSTDSTLDIIKSYAEKDDRIKIIDKKNEGYGKSMNRGLDVATGEYIGIVESDDWVDTDMFESLVKIADENNVDVVKSNFYRYTTTGGEKNQKVLMLPSHNLNIVINPHEETSVFFCAPDIWAAIYKRDFLVKNNIRFLESPGASYQDIGFNFKVLVCASRAYLTPQAWLHYRSDNENSSVKSTGKIFCVCDEFDEIERFTSERGELNTSMKYLIANLKMWIYIWNMNRLGGDARKQFMKRFHQEFEQARKNGYIERSRHDDRAWYNLMLQIYPNNLFYKLMRVLIALVSPIYKKRLRGFKYVYIIFDCITIKTVDIPKITIKE